MQTPTKYVFACAILMLFAVQAQAANTWTAKFNLSSKEYNQTLFKMTDAGYRLDSIAGYSSDQKSAQYAAVWKKTDPVKWWTRHDLSTAEFDKVFKQFQAKKWSPVIINGYSIKGVPHYDTLWEKKPNNYAWELHSNVGSDTVQKMHDKFIKDGYHMTYISGYTDKNDEPRFGAIWEKFAAGVPKQGAWANMTSKGYQTKVDELEKDGYRPVHVNGYTVKGVDRFAAIFEKPSDGQKAKKWVAKHDLSESELEETLKTLKGKGYMPRVVSGYGSGKTKFAVIADKVAKVCRT